MTGRGKGKEEKGGLVAVVVACVLMKKASSSPGAQTTNAKGGGMKNWTSVSRRKEERNRCTNFYKKERNANRGQ